MLLKVGANTSQLEYARATLAAVPNGYRNAVRAAVNDTVRSQRTGIARKIKEDLNLPYGEIRDRIAPRLAKGDSLEGGLTIDHHPVPLQDFKARFREKSGGGVTATMIKPMGPQVFKHNFRATMSSGHVGIFANQVDRAKVIPQSGAYAGRRIKRGPRKGQPVLRRPIAEAFGVSVMRTLEVKEGLLDQVVTDTADVFATRLASKVTWQLSKATTAVPA